MDGEHAHQWRPLMSKTPHIIGGLQALLRPPMYIILSIHNARIILKIYLKAQAEMTRRRRYGKMLGPKD